MSGSRERFDLIVVGLGAMGAATLFHARRRGLRVLGIDRHAPPHQFGSSHAETRVTRLAVGEGPQYLPFVARSHEIWRELEALTGEALLHQTGGCIVAPRLGTRELRWNDFVNATASVARTAGIDHEVLTAEEVRRRFPTRLLDDSFVVCYEPTGGVVMCERAVEIQLRLAREAGAEVILDDAVIAIEPEVDGVRVDTASGSFRGGHVVNSTGSWIRDLAHPVDAAQLEVTRQVVYWFEVDDPAQYSVDAMPFLLWTGDTIEDYLGVFPMPPDSTPGLKLLGEQFVQSTDPESVDRTVTPDEVSHFYERLVKPRLARVRPRCIRTAVCLYTNTPDDHFLIDTDPRSDRITVMSPCSGHGFKHSTALGEAVAERVATGSSSLQLAPFSRDRFGA